MSSKAINLDNHNELIIRSHHEPFLFGKRFYYKSINEVLLKRDEQSVCIGICSSNSYTGAKEFIQYTPQCVLFFRGNSIVKSYHIEHVFDTSTMQSLLLSKEEVLEKYNTTLPEEINDSVGQKDYSRKRNIRMNKKCE